MAKAAREMQPQAHSLAWGQDFEQVMVPLGELFTDHGVDPDTGAMLQRPFNNRHEVLNPDIYSPARWMREMPWVSDRGEAQRCSCEKCLRPQTGQLVRGRYHIMRGQHQVIGLRRWLIKNHPEINRTEFMVPVHLYKGLTRTQEAGCLLQADRDRRHWNTRSLRAVEVAAGDKFMGPLAEMMYKEFGYSVTGPRRLPAVQSLYKMSLVRGQSDVDAGLDTARRILQVWKEVLPPAARPQGLQINALGFLFNDPWNGKRLRTAQGHRTLVAVLQSHSREIRSFRSFQEMAYAIITWYNRRVRADDKKLRIPS